MKSKAILHVLFPNDFTKSYYDFINSEFNIDDHLFLFVNKNDEKKYASNVFFLKTRYRNHFISNAFIFFKCLRNSSKVIIHGTPVLFYFYFFFFIKRRIYWCINGYELNEDTLKSKWRISSFIQRKVLKGAYAHVTHIEGDSLVANRIFNSAAKFLYSNGYSSNTISIDKRYQIPIIEQSHQLVILVGNSTSPTNNHLSIFEMLLPFRSDNIKIYCPLSYGVFHKYRDDIIRFGREIFGNKFHPITNFMDIQEYRRFLEQIDIAIFNHDRQEAMGVTLTLLSMNKIIYINSSTTAYQSFVNRGIKIYDNRLIEKDGIFQSREVEGNQEIVLRDYSVEKLRESLSEIFND